MIITPFDLCISNSNVWVYRLQTSDRETGRNSDCSCGMWDAITRNAQFIEISHNLPYR